MHVLWEIMGDKEVNPDDLSVSVCRIWFMRFVWNYWDHSQVDVGRYGEMVWKTCGREAVRGDTHSTGAANDIPPYSYTREVC